MRRILLGIATLSLGACGEPRRQTLSIATGDPSGVYYPLGGGLASIWSRKLPEVNIKAEVTAGSVTNLAQVAKLESELAFTQSDAAADAIEGTGRFPRRLPISVLGKLYPNVVHVVAIEDGGIEAFQDLRGKRVSVGPPGSGNAVTAWNILRALGLDEDDFSVRLLNYTETANGLKDGTLDAGFIAGGIGIAAVMELAVSRPVRLVPFTDDEMATITARFPAYTAFTVPAGTYPGVDEPVQTPTLWNLLVTNRSLEEGLVYRLVKTLFDSRKELEEITSVARFIDPATAADVGQLPLHPGAKRYYDEVSGNGRKRAE